MVIKHGPLIKHFTYVNKTWPMNKNGLNANPWCRPTLMLISSVALTLVVTDVTILVHFIRILGDPWNPNTQR